MRFRDRVRVPLRARDEHRARPLYVRVFLVVKCHLRSLWFVLTRARGLQGCSLHESLLSGPENALLAPRLLGHLLDNVVVLVAAWARHVEGGFLDEPRVAALEGDILRIPELLLLALHRRVHRVTSRTQACHGFLLVFRETLDGAAEELESLGDVLDFEGGDVLGVEVLSGAGLVVLVLLLKDVLFVGVRHGLPRLLLLLLLVSGHPRNKHTGWFVLIDREDVDFVGVVMPRSWLTLVTAVSSLLLVFALVPSGTFPSIAQTL